MSARSVALSNIFIHFHCVREGGDDEKACDQTTRSCYYLRHPVIGDFACVRVRRLRSESPSQWMGRMRLGRPESRLVLEKNWPSGHAHAQWDIALLSVRLALLTRSTP